MFIRLRARPKYQDESDKHTIAVRSKQIIKMVQYNNYTTLYDKFGIVTDVVEPIDEIIAKIDGVIS